jgi:lipopolysaccharide export system protein LptA
MTTTARFFALLAVTALSAGSVHAQSLSFDSKDGKKEPITVTAEGGLEWQQNDKRFIARGNAKAIQGDINVAADELTAYYRDKTTKAPPKPVVEGEAAPEATEDKINNSQVYRVDAIGKVKIISGSDVATGSAAVYDFDKSVLVLQGDPVTLTTSDGVVTAHKTLQYWANERVALAEGDAVASDTDKTLGRRLKADKLTAYFRDDGAPSSGKKSLPKKSNGKRDITQIVGAGNVVLTTKSEVVRGDRANYNVDSGMATVDGSVKMTRDNSQLNGGFAVVNVNSGVSRLYGSAAEAKSPGFQEPARVKALLAPTPKSAEATTAPSSAPASSAKEP